MHWLIKEYFTNPLLRISAGSNYTRIVEGLISRGWADVDSKGWFGWTPLHYCAKNCATESMQLLVEKFHANVEVKDNNGKTPLFSAIENLVHSQADVTRQTLNSNNALSRFLRWLMGPAVKRERALAQIEKRHLEFIQKLVNDFHANVLATDSNGHTVAHLVVRAGHLKILRTLIVDFGVSPEVRSDLQDTPLHLAALNGRMDVVRALVEDFEARVDAVNSAGDTPLHLALRAQSWKHLPQSVVQLNMGDHHREIAVYLISEANADVTRPNRKEEKPIDLALRGEQQDLVHLLLTKGATMPAQEDTQRISSSLIAQMRQQQETAAANPQPSESEHELSDSDSMQEQRSAVQPS